MKILSKVHSNLKRNKSIKSAKGVSPPISPPKKKEIPETNTEMETNIEIIDMTEKSTPKEITQSDEVNIN